jgi:hypothetical protein
MGAGEPLVWRDEPLIAVDGSNRNGLHGPRGVTKLNVGLWPHRVSGIDSSDSGPIQNIGLTFIP